VVVSPSADLEEEPVLRVTPPSADAPSLKTAANPWLAARDDVGSSRAVKRKEIVISKDSSARDKSKHKLRKQVLKTGEEQEKARTDAELEISVDNVLLPAVASASAKGKGKTKKSAAPDAVDNKNDEHDSEVEFQEQLLQRKVKKSGAFQQRDLVAAAFAGDNVVQVSHFDSVQRSCS
jgi:U3 small nucleolar RNA-associated protein 14